MREGGCPLEAALEAETSARVLGSQRKAQVPRQHRRLRTAVAPRRLPAQPAGSGSTGFP